MPYELAIQGDFSAAHRLREYHGKCERLHGHNWHVELRLEGDELDDEGMLIDFTEARRLLGEVLEAVDHRYLNEVPPFDRLNPSCEHLARWIADEVGRRLPERVRVSAATAWESDRCAATYRPPAGRKER